MLARYISIAIPDQSEWVPISDGSKPSLVLLIDAHAVQSTVILCHKVICLSRPWRQIVQTGVSSMTLRYVQILCTRCAHCRTGQRFASSVLPWMTVSFFMSIFCISNVIATLSANSRLSEEAKSRCPSLKNLIFLRQRSFVCFCSLLGTLEYSQDLQAKKAMPIVSCTIALLRLVTCHSASLSSTENGRAFCCFSFGSSFLYARNCLDRRTLSLLFCWVWSSLRPKGPNHM